MASGRFELHQLRCFVAVANELNFRRAAERLNMTQPPLSRQIQLLEARLGIALFERGNRSVRLTLAGKSFLASATDLLQRAEHAVLKARQAARGEAGSVHMGFVPSAALQFVPRLVVAINRDLPEVKFRPTEMMSYEIIEALRTGNLDFGLTRAPGEQGEIDSTLVVSESFVLALPARHPLARLDTVTLADLDDCAFIGYSAERGGFLRDVLRRVFLHAGVTPIEVQAVSQTQTLIALVNEGLGVGLVPSSAQAQLMSNLVYRAIVIPRQFRSDLYLCVAAGRQTPLQDAVRATLVAAFTSDA